MSKYTSGAKKKFLMARLVDSIKEFGQEQEKIL